MDHPYHFANPGWIQDFSRSKTRDSNVKVILVFQREVAFFCEFHAKGSAVRQSEKSADPAWEQSRPVGSLNPDCVS
jgi:hypothetical protein